MSCSIIYALLISIITANLRVVSPPELVAKFDFKNDKGSIEYSVSTFGEILFN